MKILTTFALLGAGLFGFAGCGREDGPLEEVGEELDDIGDEIEDVFDD